jgi:ADP-ribose pyrophosphatase
MADEVLFRGPRWSLVSRSEPSRAGRSRRRAVIVHPGSVVVLPWLDDGRVVLIRNERVSVGRALLELPAGTRELHEDPSGCAARELREETGYEATELASLTEFFLAPGSSDERMEAFVARGLREAGQRLEDDERITVVPTPWDECLAMARDGRIADAKTLAVLLYWAAFRRS